MQVYSSCIRQFLTDHLADANMVIESLKQSKAVRTNVQKLMRRLPDGMNDFYMQKLQRLGQDDREILLTALRWLMCSEGEIQTELVADDIERCYEDSDYDEDRSEDESDEAFGSSSEAIRTSTGLEAQEEIVAYKDRESVKALKTVGRDFLKFSSAVVSIQHRSVRDFLKSQERSLPHHPNICPECAQRMNQESTYQASPKHGHLIMVENIFRKLMSPSFQDKFIIIKEVGTDRADGTSSPPSPQRQASDTFLSNRSAGRNETPQPEHEDDIGNQASTDAVSLSKETTGLPTQATVESQKASLPPELIGFDADNVEPPRYELGQWPRHLRAAEEAWPAAERDADMQERWRKLYNTIERFLSPESFVFICWSKRLRLWNKRPIAPLHVVAFYGLLEMMERYISYGTNVDVSDEYGWTPLHFACSVERGNVGIQVLVEHKADVNALTRRGQTPLVVLAAKDGSSHKIQYLLDHGAKAEIANEDDVTCLHLAAATRNLELCDILLQCTTVDINAKDSEGDTPLHCMFINPNASYELVKLFLDKGSNVNEQNDKSQGPLYAACLVGNVAAARLLLDYGADIDDDDEVFGRTALHAAITESNLELVKLMVERGADIYRQDKNGRDCFAQAADENEVDIFQYFLTTFKSEGSVTQHLLAQDLDGDTPLHRSAFQGHHEMVEILLNNGVDAMARNNRGNLPLETAFQGWKFDYNSRDGNYGRVCEKLLEFSPDTAEKEDMLDFFIEKGATKLSEALVKTMNNADSSGWTPKILAEQYEHQDIARVLSQNVCPKATEGFESTGEAASMSSPSRWDTAAKHPQLIISEDGLEVSCPTGKLLWNSVCVFSTDLQQTPKLRRTASHEQTIQFGRDLVSITTRSASLKLPLIRRKYCLCPAFGFCTKTHRCRSVNSASVSLASTLDSTRCLVGWEMEHLRGVIMVMTGKNLLPLVSMTNIA